MAAFMHFWRMTAPAQYFDLDADEHSAMARYMNKVAEARNRKGG